MRHCDELNQIAPETTIEDYRMCTPIERVELLSNPPLMSVNGVRVKALSKRKQHTLDVDVKRAVYDYLTQV